MTLPPRRRGFAWIALLSVLPSPAALAQGVSREVPLPSSIDESLTAIERSFAPPAHAALTLFPDARKTMPDTLPAFFRDSQVEVSPRSVYRDLIKTTTTPTVTEAWAAGGAVTVRTGRLFDLVSGGATLYTSQPLYAPQQWGNTQLLLPDQTGYTTFGQLYGQLHLPMDNVVTAGRYTYNTPFLAAQDNRMTPNTFYGYTLAGKADLGNGAGARYGGGYVATMKPRDAEMFTSMSRVAGASADRGTGVAGGMVTWGPLSVGAIEYYTQDTINIAYGEGKYGFRLSPDFRGIVALQYADQRSTGDNLLTGSAFATDEFGARLQLGYAGAILTVAYSTVDAGYQMQSPWSSNPFYTDAQILGYQRAGENAFNVGASLDLSPIGLHVGAGGGQAADGERVGLRPRMAAALPAADRPLAAGALRQRADQPGRAHHLPGRAAHHAQLLDPALLSAAHPLVSRRISV